MSINVNNVIVAGNLTRDPDLRYTANGTAVGAFVLAVNRKYLVNGEQKEEVSFVKVTVWGKQAENCGEYLQKGSAVLVEGRIKQDRWEDESGSKKEKTGVTANRVHFVGKPKGARQQGDNEGELEEIPF